MTQEELLALINQAADEGWTELDLAGKGLSSLPSEIGKLTQLETLILGKVEKWEWVENKLIPTLVTNQLSTLPAELAALTDLKTLNLSGNPLAVIPDCVFQLPALESLTLVSTGLSEIPVVIGSLTNLTTLYLSSNQISEMTAVIGSLTNLKELYLYSNQISEIPACIGSLTNLTTLYLSSNQISEIPAVIGSLTNLKELDFEQNQITQIPDVFSQLTNLEKLDLRGNPIPIPPDILALKPDEKLPDARPILDYYFRTQNPSETTYRYEAKILIVGEGGSGKTSLACKLLNSTYELPPETANTSTQGIDIMRWEFTGRNQQAYRVNIWDFGGQEIYHQTHQFFLTDRSLYLLVADSRKEDTDHYFWLQIIRLLSDDSPVLLIQNEKQNRACNLNLRELRAEFENLKPPLKLNLADNRGLSDAQTAIQHSVEELLPQGIPFPNSWLSVRYALENDGRNYIDCAEYEATCRYHGISRREEMFDLSGFLHSLGICLHFQKDPILCHRLILKPNWGTAAVYKILDNDRVKQNLGQFTDADLFDIWRSSQYANMHHELLQLMKTFKVCYEIPQRNGNYIAPHLLLPDQPEYDWDASQNLTLRYRYKGFMPKGILTRFIVERHELIENVSQPDAALVWKNGVVLKRDRARAEIIERYQDREIRIRLSGTNQRDFLVILNHEFQKIHASYERLNYDTLIPCNCTTCKANPKSYSFTLDRLRQFIDQRRPTIQCYESSEDVNVRRLLDDTIEPERDRLLHGKGAPRELDEIEGFFDGSYERGYREFSNRLNLPNFTINVNQQQGDHKPVTENTNNLQGANIGNFANEVKDNARQQTNQHIHQATNQNLAQAAKDIKDLLNQLDQEYDSSTPTGQAIISAKAIEAIDKNPTLKARVVNALKEGGTTALEVAIDHPAVKPVVALLKGFMDAK